MPLCRLETGCFIVLFFYKMKEVKQLLNLIHGHCDHNIILHGSSK